MAMPTFTIGIPGQSFGVQVDLLNQSPDAVTIEAVSVEASDGKAWKIGAAGEPPKSLAGRAQTQVRFSVAAPPDAALTRPYFTGRTKNRPTTTWSIRATGISRSRLILCPPPRGSPTTERCCTCRRWCRPCSGSPPWE